MPVTKTNKRHTKTCLIRSRMMIILNLGGQKELPRPPWHQAVEGEMAAGASLHQPVEEYQGLGEVSWDWWPGQRPGAGEQRPQPLWPLPGQCSVRRHWHNMDNLDESYYEQTYLQPIWTLIWDNQYIECWEYSCSCSHSSCSSVTFLPHPSGQCKHLMTAFLTAPRQLGHMPPSTCHLLTITCHLPTATCPRKKPPVGRLFF